MNAVILHAVGKDGCSPSQGQKKSGIAGSQGKQREILYPASKDDYGILPTNLLLRLEAEAITG